MKWLQDNPIGLILTAISGVFVLIALSIAIIWNLPVSTETVGVETEVATGDQANLAARQIGVLGDYQVINEKPVFNESRQPIIAELDDEPQVDDIAIEVKDAPDVKLTGIVITPSARIASLTPADGKIEVVMAHEGESLTGDFVGWRVAAVNPRDVVLESLDGQSLNLDLQIHDVKIQEPPPIVAPATTSQAPAGQGVDTVGEDDEPLSRAEQIRQRIAERREELRLEQEAQQSQSETQTATAGRSTKPSAYESAIRALMKNKSKDQGTNDKKDG
jgi:hypothetical protein